MSLGYLAEVGVLLVLIGLALLVIGALRAAGGQSKGAVVVVVGPIPIAIGNDRKLLALAMALALVALLVFIVLGGIRP
ncbi:MAG: TIGR00304 family membrane protein [Conexivisphaera sp.]